MYVSPRSASRHYKVSEYTLRRWADANKLECKKTEGGHRRYKLGSKEGEEEDLDPRRRVIYARVSSSKQGGDLKRQIKYMLKKFPKYDIISDIGGGANFKRPGFNSLLEQVFKGDIREIACFSRDRLTRFGIDLVQKICDFHNTKLVFLEEEGTEDEDLAKDLLTVITHFTAKYYGSRSYKEGEENKNIS